jgi:hypothetical protein
MTPYHGTPAGGKREEAYRFLKGRHALVPWVRPEDLPTVAAVCQSFCLDNGAFTAWKQQKPITKWEGYYQWVRDWYQHPGFDFAIIPDVIDGDEQQNDAMIAKWVNWNGWPKRSTAAFIGAPVWHLHESVDRLVRLCKGWPRVCLGSSGQWATPGTPAWWTRMREAMDAICDEQGRPITKLHGLRMLSPKVFTKLPLASADSTNAVRNGSSLKRFGMYTPASNGARQAIIADRIEAHQSAAVFKRRAKQKVLFLPDHNLAGG